MIIKQVLIALLISMASGVVHAKNGMDIVSVTTDPSGAQTYSVSIQILLLMTMLSLLPAALMMMTSTR